MKLLAILALVASVAAGADDLYSRYENFNVDEIIDNERLLNSWAKCFSKGGKCTPEAADMNKVIPDAIQTNCGECSEHQKTLAARMMHAIMQKVPEGWAAMQKIHNPDGKYDEQIKEFVEKYGKSKQ